MTYNYHLIYFLRDANANTLMIWTQQCPNVSGDYYLNFLDDGDGMDHGNNFDYFL